MSTLSISSKSNVVDKPPYYLSVIAIFKNESHGIKEWIEHYLREGVNHFYMIDNGSTDTYQEAIVEFIEMGLITLIHDDTKWAQVDLYNKYFLPLKNDSEWFAICDLDEFIYARNGFQTIAEFLQSLSERTGAVRIPWKMFGSSNHFDQPKSIIQSFLKRAIYGGSSISNFFYPTKTHSKGIYRTKFLKSLHLHFSYLERQSIAIGPDRKKLSYPKADVDKNFQPISEKILSRSFIHLNHYALQSKKWFLEVKCMRGAADAKDHENVRDLEYFKKYDEKSNELIDDELSKKERIS